VDSDPAGPNVKARVSPCAHTYTLEFPVLGMTYLIPLFHNLPG